MSKDILNKNNQNTKNKWGNLLGMTARKAWRSGPGFIDLQLYFLVKNLISITYIAMR